MVEIWECCGKTSWTSNSFVLGALAGLSCSATKICRKYRILKFHQGSLVLTIAEKSCVIMKRCESAEAVFNFHIPKMGFGFRNSDIIQFRCHCFSRPSNLMISAAEAKGISCSVQYKSRRTNTRVKWSIPETFPGKETCWMSRWFVDDQFRKRYQKPKFQSKKTYTNSTITTHPVDDSWE